MLPPAIIRYSVDDKEKNLFVLKSDKGEKGKLIDLGPEANKLNFDIKFFEESRLNTIKLNFKYTFT